MITKAAGLTSVKLLLNSVISLSDSISMTADVKNFYLSTPMKDPEYMRIPIKLIPNEILEEYKVSEFEHDVYFYVKINKGMYGLAQTVLLETSY